MEQTEQNTLVRVAYTRHLRTEHEFLDSENRMGHNAEKPNKLPAPTQHDHTNTEPDSPAGPRGVLFVREGIIRNPPEGVPKPCPRCAPATPAAGVATPPYSALSSSPQISDDSLKSRWRRVGGFSLATYVASSIQMPYKTL